MITSCHCLCIHAKRYPRQTFSERFLGRAGGVLYTIIVCLTALGSVNVKTFTFGRITQSAADRHYLPGILKTVACEPEDDCPVPNGASPPPATGWLAALRRPIRYRDGSIPL